MVANLTWGFQNTPNMFKLIEFWLRYLRSKTNDMILKSSSKLIEIDKNLIKSIHFVSKVIDSTFKTSHWLLKNDSYWHWCPQKCFECWINYFWDKMYRLHEIFVYFYQFTGIFLESCHLSLIVGTDGYLRLSSESMVVLKPWSDYF